MNGYACNTHDVHETQKNKDTKREEQTSILSTHPGSGHLTNSRQRK